MEEITEEEIKRIKEVRARRNDNKFYCYKCKGETRHKIVFEKNELIYPREVLRFDKNGKRMDSLWTVDAHVWKLTECLGCEKTNLYVFIRNNPLDDDFLIHHYPMMEFRPFPEWITYIDRDFFELCTEIYRSLNLGSIRLSLMGVRTLLDMFIVKKVGDVGNFPSKLQELVDEKYISTSSRDLLETALEFGNATIHRGYFPSKDEVNGVFDIIENILQNEALKDKTKKLKKPSPRKSLSKNITQK